MDVPLPYGPIVFRYLALSVDVVFLVLGSCIFVFEAVKAVLLS